MDALALGKVVRYLMQGVKQQPNRARVADFASR